MSTQTKNSTSGSKTKILIADDHPVVAEGIIRAFQTEPDFEIVGTALDGLEAVKLAKTLNPDIVIMDISMPNMKGIDAAHDIKIWKKQVHVLIYTMYSEKEYVTTLFRLGVSGYMLKCDPIKDLVQAAKVVRNGGTYFSHTVRKVIQDQLDELTMGKLSEVRQVQDDLSRLTVREKEIFVLLADGLIPKEIAKRLAISPKTVETHKYNLMEKLEVSSVAQLTKIAVKKHFIEI